MKILLLSLTGWLIAITGMQAQSTIQTCPFGSSMENALQNDIFVNQRAKQHMGYLHTIAQQSSPQTTNPLLIPVVVHIMHNAGEQPGQGINISYAQVESQIDKLNAAFANDTVYTQLSSGQWAVNTGIQFCLAKVPMGTSWSNANEPGVMRYVTPASVTNHIYKGCDTTRYDSAMLAITHPAPGYFPFANYLNIWTVNQITDGGTLNIAGYAPNPICQILSGNSFILDGIVMDVHMFGDNTVNSNNFPIYPQYNTGNILVHEAGHYLSMFHTFTSGCAGMSDNDCATQGDFICDTPPTTNQSSCVSVDNCTENITPWGNRSDIPENYMTWADDNCLNTFTLEQGFVMNAELNTVRQMLVSDLNLSLTGVASPGGCIPAQFITGISFSGQNCVNDTIQFSTYSGIGFLGVSWQWSFAGGTPATFNGLQTGVVFAAPGQHQVILVTTDSAGNTISDTTQVLVSPCSPLQSTQGIWYFGHHSGIDFSTGTPQVDNIPWNTRTMSSVEAAVSISDSTGSILFYTDADTIWDKNYQPVITGLFASGNFGNTRSQIISVPHPVNPKWHYIFYGPHDNTSAAALHYAIISDTNNTIAPIVIDDTVTRPPGCFHVSEELTAIPHCNGRDYFILTRPAATILNSLSFSNLNRVYVYLISPAGITNPLNAQSPLPSTFILQNQFSSASFGQMKASPDNSKIIMNHGNGVSVVDFNNTTGVLSNEFYFNNPGYTYGCSFSPNSDVVYYSAPSTSTIFGIDLTQQNPVPVAVVNGVQLWAFQLGPDSALYMIDEALAWTQNSYVTRLSNPNNINAPGFQPHAVRTDTTFTAILTREGLPNFIDGIPNPRLNIGFSYNVLSCSSVEFTIDSCWAAYSVVWNFGDNTPVDTNFTVIHNYSTPGTYTVSMTLSVGSYTFPPVYQTISIYPTAPPITGSAVVCSGLYNPVQYSVPTGFTSYQWTTTGGGSIFGSSTQSNVQVSWSGNGTLTCVMINGANCTLTSTMTVTLVPAVIAEAGSDTLYVCSNGYVMIGGNPTASGGTQPYSYSWQPVTGLNSSTIPNPVASISTNTTYTVLVTDNNGCVASDIVTMLIDTVNTSPIVILDPLPSACENSSGIDLLPFASPPGGVFMGTGVNGNSFDPVISGTGQFTVTYTYTNSNGCSGFDTSSIFVLQCCTIVNGINTFDQDRSSTYGLSFNNNVPTPVAISGTFIVDNIFTLNAFAGNDHIRLAPDAKIVIKQNCRLTANACLFQRCADAMWESIIIEPGGELVLNGCQVRDAKAPVTSLGGAKYTINSTDFQRNYIGLKVEPASGIHPGTIVSSTIVGSVLGYPPYAGVRSRYGIQLTQVDSIVIGAAGALTNENTIRDVEAGVYALTSKVGLVRNRFLNITQSSMYIQPGCCAFNTCNDPAICFAPQVGVGVWVIGGRATIGGTNAATDANRFKDCTNGILAEADATITIRNNEFQQIESSNPNILSYGIWVRRCKGVTHWITDNQFLNSRNGIYYEFNSAMSAFLNNNRFNDFRHNGIYTKQNPNVSFTIQSNQFNTQWTGTPGKYGIRIQNAVIGQTISLAFITGNIIKQCDKGIWLTKAPYSLVTQGNQVEFPNAVPSITSIGIQVQNSEATLIDANAVLKLGAPPSNDSLLRERLYGISVEYGSFNTNVSNNNLSRVGSGVHFYGTSNYPSTVNCNLLVQNMAGIRMNNSFIGDQGAGISLLNPDGVTHDNLFTFNSTNNGQITFYRNQSDPFFNWHCRTITTGSPTTNPSGTTMIPPLTAMTMVSAFPDAPEACYYQNPSPDELQQQELALIATRSYPFDSLTTDQLVMADQTAMKQLKDNPALMSLNTPYDLILIDYYMEQLGESVERTDEVHRLATAGDTIQARIVNDGIVPDHCIDASQKTVNTIYLKTWAQGIPYFTPADSALLYMVATENVNNCGTAVYDARVMLGMDIDDFGPNAVHRPVWENNGNSAKGNLYPNPATGDAVYERELNEHETGHIEIMDLPGHVLLTKSLTVKTEIPATTLTNGIYLYRVYVNGKLVDTGKLTVLH